MVPNATKLPSSAVEENDGTTALPPDNDAVVVEPSTATITGEIDGGDSDPDESEPPPPNVLEYITFLLWGLLSLTSPAVKYVAFATIFPTEETFTQLINSVALTFAPGLLECMTSLQPPTMAWFKQLPTLSSNAVRVWGVYALVLEKPGERSRLYVGSGTDSVHGLWRRLSSYDSGQALPSLIEPALNDGWIIVHKRVLCQTALPSLSNYFLSRALILAIESLFSVVFWAMFSKTNDYGSPPLCPWDRAVLGYDGLCSHTALIEGIRGVNENLTLEETARDESERLAKASAQKSAHYFDLKPTDWAAWKAARRRYEAKHEHGEKLRSMYASKAKAKRERRFACNTRNLAFEENGLLQMHYKTNGHKNKVAGIPRKQPKSMEYTERSRKNRALKRFYCEFCDYAAGQKLCLESHCRSATHKKKEAAAKAAGWKPKAVLSTLSSKPKRALRVQHEPSPLAFKAPSEPRCTFPRTSP
ncbi:hypothetical protein EJ08DRAFT_263104 [Tothia fuscella]|uniref:C2H2-type domain-containing protein n=1 Tax=Tothia fuscella TaxID=1048955 RepID=A0A9P4TY34_9PEZI|nr:hypothetical protein EJ08DRAFT_263104 [Tothia fuscella]